MELQRAKEILESPHKITVLHQGEAVWIHQVDPSQNQAHISLERSPEVRKTVPLHELEEKKIGT